MQLIKFKSKKEFKGWLTDLEIAWMTLEKPTASFSSSWGVKIESFAIKLIKSFPSFYENS